MLSFKVTDKKTFDMPLSAVSQANPGKHEVALTLHQDDTADPNDDTLVEMRIYVPSESSTCVVCVLVCRYVCMYDCFDRVRRMSVPHNNSCVCVPLYTEDGQNPVEAFCDRVKKEAKIGVSTDHAIASFSNLLFLVPRGRNEVDLHGNFLALHGKTMTYNIPYDSVNQLFLFHGADEIHNVLVVCALRSLILTSACIPLTISAVADWPGSSHPLWPNPVCASAGSVQPR